MTDRRFRSLGDLLLALVLPPLAVHGSLDAQTSRRRAERTNEQNTSFLVDAGLGGQVVFDIDFDPRDDGSPDSVVWIAASQGLCRYDGYRWKRFGQDHGLPGDYVRCVRVARDRTVWVGTAHGAGTFDGARYRAVGTDGPLAGRSVRRIVEDRDGGLWFCCDQWPDRSVRGALVRLHDGRFQTLTAADGLPSEYVSDLFEDSRGVRYVLTRAGLGRIDGGRVRRPLEEAGLSRSLAGGYFWSMVECADGRLVAATADARFVLDSAGWRVLPGPLPGVPRPFLMRSDEGDVLTCSDGAGGRILRWGETQSDLEPLSEPFGCSGATVEVIRQAPDGTIWVGGERQLMRWLYRDQGEWTQYPRLPQPQFVDASGAVWCADADRAVRLSVARREPVAGMRLPLVQKASGVVWGSSTDGIIRWDAGATTHFDQRTVGVDEPRHLIVDGAERLWIVGSTSGRHAFAHYAGTWSPLPEPPFEETASVVHVVADPDDGVWCVLSGERGNRVVRVHTKGLLEVPLTAALRDFESPRVFIDSDRRLWAFGFFGAMWIDARRPTDWVPVSLPGQHVIGIAERDDGLWFAFDSLTGGESGFLHWHGATREFHPGQVYAFLGRSAAGDLFYGRPRGLIVIGTGSESVPRTLNVPTRTRPRSAVEAPDGSIWVGFPRGVLRYRADGDPPETFLAHAVPAIQFGDPAIVSVRAREKYRTWALPNEFAVSYRVDDGPWTPFRSVDVDSLRLEGLALGQHVFEAVVRDQGGDVDPTAEAWTFDVLPLPFQRRWWFWPIVGLLAAVLVGLTWIATRARRRIALHARELESEVKERTVALAAREVAYRRLFEQSQDAIYLTDLEGAIVDANPAAVEMFGYPREQLLGLRAGALFALASHEPTAALRRRESGISSVTRTGRTCDGLEIHVQASVNPRRAEDRSILGYQVVLRDVTRQTELEEQLRHTQKMEAVGRLAGGIAHDFNNLLTVIVGNAELLRERVDGGVHATEDIEAILDSASRAQTLTRQLQTFSRGQIVVPRVVDPNENIRALTDLLRRTIGEDIVLSMELDPAAGRVRIDPGQFDQIVVNLVLNARDAIPDGGNVELTTRTVELDAAAAQYFGVRGPGTYVRVAVSDDGHGMDAETRDRVFEPFFTTKADGRGDGLGLATAYGIVQQHGGAITVTSAPGRGARFDVYLPSCSDRAESSEDRETGSDGIRGGDETILVVEDQRAIRELLCRTLNAWGYRVLTAENGARAVELIESTGSRAVDVVVTDIVMPGMSGLRLAAWLRDHRPEIKRILMSGYSDAGPEAASVLGSGDRILDKPLQPHELKRALRETLDRRPAPA